MPVVYPFTAPQSGCTRPELTPDSPRIAFFKNFFDVALVTNIVIQSNLYASFLRGGRVQTPHSRMFQADVSVDEMYSFLGLVLLMGIIKKNRLEDYWTTDPMVSTPFFGRVMSRNRFQAILGSLHFFNALDPATRASTDKMRRIRMVFDYLKDRFLSSFYPYRDLVIDESLLLWRGNISFRQYIPSKRHRFGFKLFVMCDCKSGYVQDIVLYTGDQTELVDDRSTGLSGAVVKTMIDRYLHCGHVLYLDNWYTSPLIAKYLHLQETGICGTVKAGRRHMVKSSQELGRKLLRKEVVFYKCNNILATSWYHNREVNLLSTIHRPLVHRTESIDYKHEKKVHIWKPEAVLDYNINMRQVDQSDAMISSVECARATMKWYKKLFFHLLDITTLNAHLLFAEVTGEKETFESYIRELCREIFAEHAQDRSTRATRPTSGETPLRLRQRHFPRLVPGTAARATAQRRCHVCQHTTIRPARQRKDSRYQCTECDVGLCITPCFEEYHTKLHF